MKEASRDRRTGRDTFEYGQKEDRVVLYSTSAERRTVDKKKERRNVRGRILYEIMRIEDVIGAGTVLTMDLLYA